MKGPDPTQWGEEQIRPSAEINHQRTPEEWEADRAANREPPLDVTDRDLWYDALTMAADEGTLGSFSYGDPYGERDRLMAEYDRLRSLDRP